VLIFSEPEKAAKHGYTYDGWAGPRLLHYTGEGRHGDQRFVEGNKAIRDHLTQGRALRVFRAKPPWVTYLGEFEIAADPPYYVADALDDDDVMRQVVVFRLIPVGQFVDGTLPPALDIAGTKPSPSVEDVSADLGASTDVDPEKSNVSGYTVTPPDEPIEAIRREAALVCRYKSWLDRHGRKYRRQRISIPDELSPLLTDLYDVSEEELIEAKASAARTSVRAGARLRSLRPPSTPVAAPAIRTSA
jgi:hypothetical protein